MLVWFCSGLREGAVVMVTLVLFRSEGRVCGEGDSGSARE